MQCSEKVIPNDRWGAFHAYQCQKEAKVERDGKWYCKIHDPEYIKQKAVVAHQKWQNHLDNQHKITIRQDVMSAIFQGIPTEEIEQKAEVYKAAPELYVALKTLMEKYWKNKGDSNSGFIACITPNGIPDYWRDVEKALNKAEGKV